MRPPDETPDGDWSPGIGERELYRIVRLAVEDAILGVLGTILLLGVAAVVALTGVRIIANATSTAWVALGLGVALFGVYVGAATLGVIPSVREYLASR